MGDCAEDARDMAIKEWLEGLDSGEICFLCDAPWTPEHPKHCPEWPKEDRHESD